MMNKLEQTYKAILHGKWTYGYDYWQGKPKFYIASQLSKGIGYVVHVGNFWVYLEYL